MEVKLETLPPAGCIKMVVTDLGWFVKEVQSIQQNKYGGTIQFSPTQPLPSQFIHSLLQSQDHQRIYDSLYLLPHSSGLSLHSDKAVIFLLFSVIRQSLHLFPQNEYDLMSAHPSSWEGSADQGSQ